MGYSDAVSMLSKQLMPVLRLLDSLFKENELPQNSPAVHAFLWLTLRLKARYQLVFLSGCCCFPAKLTLCDCSKSRLIDLLCSQHPHAGAYINPLSSLTLRVLDRHETIYKVIAICILSHLLAEADPTQIRWHAELLFDNLKRQLVYRELEISKPLLPALTQCAITLEVTPGGPRVSELLLVRPPARCAWRRLHFRLLRTYCLTRRS